MSEFKVTVFVNTGPDNFFGYKPDAPLAEVMTLRVKATNPQHAAEEAFRVGNRMGCDLGGAEWPSDVRSVSVGDVVVVTDSNGVRTFLAVASFGFDVLPGVDPNQFVPLAGQFRVTSREPA